MQTAIVALWDHWDDARLAAIAADNLELDRPFSQRREELQSIKSDMGMCHPVGGVEPENLLRGKFRMTCERGLVEVQFTLAPTMPPKLQWLQFSSIQRLDRGMKAMAEGIASAIASPLQQRLAALADTELDAAGLRQQLEAARASYGSCRVGEALEGTRATEARVLLECDRRQLELRFRAGANGKLASATFVRPHGVECVP